MIFKDGNYVSKIDKPIKLKAHVLIKNSKIANLHLYNDKGKIDSELEEVFRGQIIDKQSVNIDGVTSASVLTKAVKSAVGNALTDAIEN